VSADSLGGLGSYQPTTPFPDLITSVTNGLGAQTSVTYKPATDATVYSKTSGAVFPVIEVKAPIYVVSSTSVTNAIGGSLTTNYQYTGARTNLQAGFLGFRKFEATDAQTGLKSATTFRQDYPYQWLPLQSVTTQSSSVVVNQVDNTWTDTVLTPAAGSGGNYHKAELTGSTQRTYELNGSLVTTVTTSTAFDGYGNANTVTVGTGDGYSKATTNTYTNDALNWILGRLTRSTVQSTAP
jgi:hypothetical protein